MVEFQDIAKVAKQHPQIFHAGLGMLLQLEWEYLQRKVHWIGSLTELLEAVLREAFFRALFGGRGGQLWPEVNPWTHRETWWTRDTGTQEDSGVGAQDLRDQL